MLARVRSYARNLRRRSAFEDAMDDEMRFHLESRTADLVRRGLPPEAARRRARLEFGSIEKQKDLARANVGIRLLDELRGDFRYALRTLARDRGFAAAAVLTLALGIGANTAIFSLIDALMLRSLPVNHPEQLLQLTLGSPTDQTGAPSFSYPMIRALDAERGTFAGVAGFGGYGCASGAGETLHRVPCAVVTGAFYDTLGLVPAAGRLLTRADDEPGAPLVAVASYGYWERQFAASPAVIGQTIAINGVPVTLIGVSPPGFVGANVGMVADLTVPVAAVDRLTPSMAALLGKGNSWLRVLARLRDGTTEEQAAGRLAAAWPRISHASIDPSWPAFRQQGVSDAVIRMGPGATGWTYLRDLYVKPLRVLMGSVTLVLLIACANVASLLLARTSARRKEFAVRMAIGAGRARLTRQLLVESLTLALFGAAGGVWLAAWGSRLLVGMISTAASPIVFDLAPNWRVVGFVTVVASATAVLFGLAPALRSASVDAAVALNEDARTATTRLRLLPFLVTLQIALSLVLLFGASLFVRTLRNLQMLDPGFRTQGILLVELERRPHNIPISVLESVRAIPGVLSASIATHTPLSGSTWSDPAVPAGQPLPDRDNTAFIGTSPGFFSTLGIAFVTGRDFSDRDAPGTPTVAIVNERYADAYFPHQNPVGQHLTATVNGQRRDLEIVGLVRNTSTRNLRGAPPRIVYVAYSQLTGLMFANVVVRANGSLADVSSALVRLLQPLSPLTPLDARALSDQVQGTLARERLMASLASGFGALALALASIGMYGLLAYGVARRTREIGIRMALGARPSGVVALILRAAWMPLVLGIGVGLPAAWGLARLIRSMLFGLTPADPLAVGVAALLLVAVAHAAAYVPARRASRVDPLVALRRE